LLVPYRASARIGLGEPPYLPEDLSERIVGAIFDPDCDLVTCLRNRHGLYFLRRDIAAGEAPFQQRIEQIDDQSTWIGEMAANRRFLSAEIMGFPSPAALEAVN
jgi:hypothetical protein